MNTPFFYIIAMNKIKVSILSTAFILLLVACHKEQTDYPVQESSRNSTLLQTKGLGDKEPMVAVYIETNDTNPLNAGDYYLQDGTTFYDCVQLFSANIHRKLVNGVYQPSLYFNEKMVNIFENGGVQNYIQPLQEQGIAVLMCVIGNWQNIGLSTMNDTQTTQFAQILSFAVDKYGLDGICFGDEYAGVNTVVSGSYSNIILKFRELQPNAIITVFDWGATSSISSAAAAEIDYVYHGYYGYYLTHSYSNVTGIMSDRWSPISLTLGNTYSASTLNTIRLWSSNAYNADYAAIMHFNLRQSSDVDPLPVMQAHADALDWGTVYCTNGDRPRSSGYVPGGYTITYSDALQGMTP